VDETIYDHEQVLANVLPKQARNNIGVGVVVNNNSIDSNIIEFDGNVKIQFGN
jgi:hypothetical protein